MSHRILPTNCFFLGNVLSQYWIWFSWSCTQVSPIKSKSIPRCSPLWLHYKIRKKIPQKKKKKKNLSWSLKVEKHQNIFILKAIVWIPRILPFKFNWIKDYIIGENNDFHSNLGHGWILVTSLWGWVSVWVEVQKLW